MFFSARPSLALLTLSAALLSACDGGVDPPSERPAATFQVNALSPAAALRSGDRTVIRVTVTPANGFAGPVRAELVGAPAGVSAEPVTATVAATTTLELTVETHAAAGLLRLPIRVTGGDVTQEDEAFAFVYRVSTLPSGDSGCLFPNCHFPAGSSVFAGGTYWVKGDFNSSASPTVLGVTARDGQVQTHRLTADPDYAQLAGLAVTPEMLWTGVSAPSDSAALLGFDPVTQARLRVPVGEQRGTLINVVALPDGRVAFLHSSAAPAVWSIGVYDPAGEQLTPPPVAASDNFLFGLRVAADGALWTAEGYGSPALVRFDPTTRAVRKFSIGTTRDNLALSLAPTEDGKVWYLDSWANTLNVFDPANTSVVTFRKTFTSAQLYPLGTDVLLVNSDGFNRTVELLSTEGGGLAAIPLPILLGQNNDLDGFAVSAEGDLAYESSGQAYVLPVR